MSDEVLFQHPALPRLLPLPGELRREQISLNQTSDDPDSLVASFCQSTSGICVRERLRDHIQFWREIGASKFVLRVIEVGYFLPFGDCPPRGCFSNLPSANSHSSFVSSSIEKLLQADVVMKCKESNLLALINPLDVVPKKRKKLRLILDLRFLNYSQHIGHFIWKTSV